MIRATWQQISTAHRDLFKVDIPAGLRCQGVLNGITPGTIFTDSLEQPTWAVIREATFGTLYPAGQVTKAILTTLVDEFRQQGDTLIGFWLDAKVDDLLPDVPQYEGRVLDFTNHPSNLDDLLQHVPEGCEVRPLDADLHQQSPWYVDRLAVQGSIEAILAHEIAFGLVRDSLLVSEASAGKIDNAVVELGTVTHEVHRGKGYSTYISAYCIRECEQHGLQTYWNCNTANLPSVAVARKLGYQSEREYRLFGWFPT
jgi:GNAT superfamily N-acetyltransferase